MNELTEEYGAVCESLYNGAQKYVHNHAILGRTCEPKPPAVETGGGGQTATIAENSCLAAEYIA